MSQQIQHGGSSDEPQKVPHGDEPGASDEPYADGQGTVTLPDRFGTGAPDTNQGRTEPMPPQPGGNDPAVVNRQSSGGPTSPPAAPTLDQMDVGTANPDIAHPDALPAHPPTGPTGQARTGTQGPAATPGVVPIVGEAPRAAAAGTVPAADRPRPGTSSSTGRGSGPALPQSSSTGTAHRAPGLQGATPSGEAVESDLDAGAARMRRDPAPHDRSSEPPGTSGGVPVPGTEPMPGTSEQLTGVQGLKDPTGQGTSRDAGTDTAFP